jgi:hypothetical protein
LPARSTLYDYFDLRSYDGTLDRLHDALYVKCREQAGREAKGVEFVGERGVGLNEA